MIRIESRADISWINLYRIAYQAEPVSIADDLLAGVDAARLRYDALVASGVPCYGVTTGLGQLVGTRLDDEAQQAIAANMLRARAAAIGAPLTKPVVRAMFLIRLVNFLSGHSAVGSDLCRFLVDRLNDDLLPWVPSLGHGMAGDAIANTHAFQTLIGEGFVMDANGERRPAAVALEERGVEPFPVSGREGLALITGICAAPALAMDAFYQLDALLRLATLVAAASMEGLAAPRDAIDPAVVSVSSRPGVERVLTRMRKHLNHSKIEAGKLQAPVSYRVIPQVHGAAVDALAALRARIEESLIDVSENPLLAGEQLLSVGCFHDQHLVNQVEQVALAVAQVGTLSERRLHRLLNTEFSGLQAQLAARPGLDAGLVVTQKAAVDLAARLRLLAQPLSLGAAETSAGQEDFMTLALPAILRLFEQVDLLLALLAYEMLAAVTALDLRAEQPGDDIAALRALLAQRIAPLEQDRAPGPDVEAILQIFDSDELRRLYD